MNIHDRVMAYKRKKLYIPVAQRSFGSVNGTTITAFNTAAAGLRFGTGSAGTLAEFVIKMPNDFNPNFPLGLRAHWGAIGTPATMGNITWKALGIFKQDGDALLSAATTAFDADFTAAQAPPAANAQKWTNRITKSSGLPTIAQVEAGTILQASIEMDAASGTISDTNAAFLFGIELDYVPMQTKAPHSENDAPIDDASFF